MREVVFDVETTGLDAKEHRVIEIGCVELINNVRTGNTFHTLINPQRQVDKGAERVHGFNYEMLKREPTFKRIAADFLAFIDDDPLIAHNADFDMGFINAEFVRLGLGRLDNKVIDTLPLARKAKPGGRHTLDSMCEFYKVDTSKRVKHGALLDSELLADVYINLLGGRQHGMDLVVVEEKKAVEAPRFAPRSLPSRLTAEEMQAHAAFVDKLGGNAIWKKYQESAATKAA